MLKNHHSQLSCTNSTKALLSALRYMYIPWPSLLRCYFSLLPCAASLNPEQSVGQGVSSGDRSAGEVQELLLEAKASLWSTPVIC